jgi:UDP-N-acetylmuramoyl-L-alanyl-D-glutamate--2,6-diaminopimelate ligase
MRYERAQSDSVALAEVFAGIEANVPVSAQSLMVQGIACDSRKVAVGQLFFALHGVKDDGNQYVQDAIKRGAIAIASASAAPPELPANVTWIRIPDSRKSLALAAANFFGHPANALQLIAVTGTNGKTTTTFLIDSVLRASGAKTGLFGTIAYRTPLGKYPAPNTTPESLDLQRFFAETRDAGGKYAVTEASSHALVMDRLWGCHFHSAVFTNLTRDHLDFHHNFEDYFARGAFRWNRCRSTRHRNPECRRSLQQTPGRTGEADGHLRYREFGRHCRQKISPGVHGSYPCRAYAEWTVANRFAAGGANQRLQHSCGHRRSAGRRHFE